MYKYRLFYLKKVTLNKNELVENKCFTSQEVLSIYKAATNVNRFIDKLYRLIPVSDAKDEVFKMCKNVDGYDPKYIHQIARSVRSYFLEFDIYLEHHKRLFQKIKKEDFYKKITSSIYDSNDYYILATVFRNYIVHSSDINHETFFNASGYKINVYKEKLLKDIHISNSGKNAIKRQSEKIDLLKVIEESFGALKKVNEIIISFFFNISIQNDIKTLNLFYDRIKNNEKTTWMVIDFTKLANNEDVIINNSKSMQSVDVEYLYWTDYALLLNMIPKDNQITERCNNVATSAR